METLFEDWFTYYYVENAARLALGARKNRLQYIAKCWFEPHRDFGGRNFHPSQSVPPIRAKTPFVWPIFRSPAQYRVNKTDCQRYRWCLLKFSLHKMIICRVNKAWMTYSVLMINQYASDPDTGYGGRSYYLCQELQSQGHKVTLVRADYSHLLRNPIANQKSYESKIRDGVQHIKLKVHKYENANSLKRAVNWFLFCWRLFFLSSHLETKPQVIICSTPSILSIWGAWYLSKIHGARLVFEIRDFWPLSLLELGTISKFNPVIIMMSIAEKFAIRYSDIIIGVPSDTRKFIEERGGDISKVVHIPNGVDLNEFTRSAPLPNAIANHIPKNKFIVGYLGTVGTANALETLVQAASLLKNDKRISFLVIGNGQQKSALQAQEIGRASCRERV